MDQQRRKRRRVPVVETDNKGDAKCTRKESNHNPESRKRTRAETNSEICRKHIRSELVKDSGAHPAQTSTDDSLTSAALGYSIIAMPGDGSCLFHSVGHASRLRQGLDPPANARAQRRLAVELRSKTVDELIKQREFVAPFVEGDYDEYVNEMRKYTKWAGDHELLMLTSVLQMPITVYRFTCASTETGPLIVAAEYGQEHMSGTNGQPPIQVLFYSRREHYDVVEFHADHHL